LAEPLKLGKGMPVIIDVLRASSTIVTALANGVTEIVPVTSQKEAFDLKLEGYLIAGEQNGVKLGGFDIGNSPTELLQVLQNKKYKRLALKTTNATSLLKSVSKAYVASTLNLDAAVVELQGKKVSLIAVGSKYGLMEDLAVAIALLSRLNGLEISNNWVRQNVVKSKAAEHLKNIGYASDVSFITNKNYNVLPKLQAGVIKDEIRS
jgi:2-phosphosulfolactate phosphatase